MTRFSSTQLTRPRNNTSVFSDLDRKIADLRYKVSAFRFSALLRKYDPNQRRDEIGRWTDGTTLSSTSDAATISISGLASDLQKIVAQARQFSLAGLSKSKCIDLCYPILERPRISDRNEWDFQKCLNICLGK